MTTRMSSRISLPILAFVLVAAFVVIFPISAAHANSTTYYVNNLSGSNCSDAGAGTSQSAPWCDFTPVNSHTFGPGDQLLLARGASWDQQMTLQGSGSSSAYATIDAYGSGANPKIIRDGNVSDRAIRMADLSYWSVNNLEVGNAGTGILVFYSTLGHQGLSFNNIYVHDIYGIHHQNLNSFSCNISGGAATDEIWNSAGIELTGNVTSIPTGQYSVQNVSFNNITGTHNLDSVSIDWCNGGAGNSANVTLNHLNLHNDNGPSSGCDEGIRLSNITNGTVMNSIFNTEGDCYSSTGTTGIYSAGLSNVTVVNSILENTPNTGSPDQTGIDFEGFSDQVHIRDDYIAGNAASGIEILTIHGSGGYNTNHEIAGNLFVNNGGGSIERIGSDATPTGTIHDNLYYEPAGFTRGDLSSFTFTNNLAVSSASTAYNAGNGFSSTQGQNGWSYQYSNDGSTWSNLPYDATTGIWQDPSKPGGVPWIGQFEQHPDVCSACWVGRAWTAATTGKISIRGRVLKSDIGGGNGIVARITKNGATIWGPQTVAYNDQVGIDANLDNVSVAAGDVLRFEVSNNGDNTYDSTSWDPSVGYTTLGSGLTAAFNRYYNGSSHWVTTGAVTGDYHLESTLGYLFTASQTGTHVLYGCLNGSTDHFISPQSNCEGQTVLRTEGWLYDSAPASPATTAIYRCYTGHDHFVSVDPNCEGQHTESLLGYVLNASQ